MRTLIHAGAISGDHANGAEQHQRTLGWQAQQHPGLSLIAGGPHGEVDRIGDHGDRPVGHQRAAAGAVGQPVAGAHVVNRPAPGAALAQPGAAVEVGPSFMGGPAGGAVASRETLIAAGGVAGHGRADGHSHSPEVARAIAW